MASEKLIRISDKAHQWLQERQRVTAQRQGKWPTIGDVLDAVIERVIEWESGESA